MRVIHDDRKVPVMRHARRTVGFFKVRGVNINHTDLEDAMFRDPAVVDFRAEVFFRAVVFFRVVPALRQAVPAGKAT